MKLEHRVDLQRYPIDALDSPAGSDLVARCREIYERTGSVQLPNFITSAGIERSLLDAAASEPAAHQADHLFRYGTSYGQAGVVDLDALPAHDPRRYMSRTTIKFVAKDRIDDGSPVKRLYDWAPMIDFVHRVVDLPTYTSGCPMSGMVFTIAYDNEEQDWHFDNNDFIVTIMLQAANEGGHFEYVPNLRSLDGIDDFDTIQSVHEGRCGRVVRPEIAPGTLTLFRGRTHYHRASPVVGNHPRIMAILTYEREPNVKGRPESTIVFYGRAAA